MQRIRTDISVFLANLLIFAANLLRLLINIIIRSSEIVTFVPKKQRNKAKKREMKDIKSADWRKPEHKETKDKEDDCIKRLPNKDK